jgi:uncharacterized protein DUF3857/uncharacterized protein DUF3858/transglutaminase superfamily protein
MKILSHVLCGILFSIPAFSQNKANIKFGSVSSSDFTLPVTNIIDSNTNAVIIADIGSTTFIGNKKGWFTLVFKRSTRIKILNEKAFHLATVHIPLYHEGDNIEKLTDVKASTYNLENGTVTVASLGKKDLFQEKLDKNHVENKFTMPAIRPGSIIEYSYTINSDFLLYNSYMDWDFQHVNYPCLWSEYESVIPNLLLYVTASQGYYPFAVDESKIGRENYVVTMPAKNYYEKDQDLTVGASTNIRHFVMKNIPAFKPEDYLTSPENYISKVEFQLSKESNDGREYTDVMNSWEKTSEELLKREDFGSSLSEDNVFLDNEITPLTRNMTDQMQIARTVYAYVKNNFTCINDEGSWMTGSLKDVFKNRKGNVADINLLLIALLSRKGISCSPVLLSTRDHGINLFKYPILSKYNYVLCQAKIHNNVYYLDATDPTFGFGKLDAKCYNGEARVINSSATPINFSADSIREINLTSLRLTANDKGEMIGSVEKVPGYFESRAIRKKILEKGKDVFFKEIKTGYGNDVELINPRVDSLDNLEGSIDIAYDFTLTDTNGDLVYINPMFGEGHKENPFKSEQRYYPVEMPYTSDETYVFNMIVPEGYVIDELPKSTVIKLNDAGDGKFEYFISESNGTISMRSRIQLKRAYYQPAEYDLLREFFNLVVKKHNEQIVLKKKK